MNRWAQWLAARSSGWHRLIARTQRVSLPRGADAATRVARLRAALCRAPAVRSTFANLNADTQAALWELASSRNGMLWTEVLTRYGTVRTLDALEADPRPQSITEHLLLLGWLFDRPGSHRHPVRGRLPTELRQWLPRRFALQGPPMLDEPALPPVLRAATLLLAQAGTNELTLTASGEPTTAALRAVVPGLAPLPEQHALAVLEFCWALLVQLGTVTVATRRATSSVAATVFLRSSLSEQLKQLQTAWIGAPDHEAWLVPLLRLRQGIDWPLLRRRLMHWAETLPLRQWLPLDQLYSVLSASLGPLADAQTHGFRQVRRSPWTVVRAEQIWQAALHGPLSWFGLVLCRETPEGWQCTRLPAFREPPEEQARWQLAAPGEVIVPYSRSGAALLRLWRASELLGADELGLRLRITPRRLAGMRRDGQDVSQIWSLLATQVGPIPASWRAGLPENPPGVGLREGGLLLADPPVALERARTPRDVARYLGQQLAPGIQLLDPAQLPFLLRALARHEIAVLGVPPEQTAAATEEAVEPATAVPGTIEAPKISFDMPQSLPARTRKASDGLWLDSADAALVLQLCVLYQLYASPQAPALALEQLESRVRAVLPAGLRQRIEGALDSLRAGMEELPAVAGPDEQPDPLVLLQTLRAALAERSCVRLLYATNGQDSWQVRLLRPLGLEQRGPHWYLRAYCMTRRAERVFRLDRMGAVQRVPTQPWVPVRQEAEPGEASDK